MVSSSYVGLTSLLLTKPQPFVKGTVLRGITPEEGTIIRVYERSTGILLNSTITKSDGSYYTDVDCLEYVYVIAISTDPLRNAKIADYIEPTYSAGVKEI